MSWHNYKSENPRQRFYNNNIIIINNDNGNNNDNNNNDVTFPDIWKYKN